MYDTSTFRKGLLVSFGVVLLVVLLFTSTGVGYAVAVAGVGDITVSAQSITGDGLEIHPTTSDEASGQPMMIYEFDNATIDGLRLSKSIAIPHANETITITATADDSVTTDHLLLKSNAVQAHNTTFSSIKADETHGTRPSDSITVNVGNGGLDDGRIVEGSDTSTVRFSEPRFHSEYMTINPTTRLDPSFNVSYTTE